MNQNYKRADYAKSKFRVNETIRSRQVRVIDPEGNQLGVLFIAEAIEKARAFGLDLVEVSPDAKPPVCKIMDYGKYKYELGKKEKQAKKNQHIIVTKTIKLSANIAEHDLLRKIEDAKKFLEKGHRVMAVVEMSGREKAHPDVAAKHLLKMQEALGIQNGERPKNQGSKISVLLDLGK